MTRRQVQRTKERGEVWGGGTRAVRSRERRGGERGRARRALVFGEGRVNRAGPCGASSAPRQYYAATARVCCLCAITSSREIDERSERGWGRERRLEDGARCRATIFSYAAIRCRSRKSRGFISREKASADPHADRSPVKFEKAWSAR